LKTVWPILSGALRISLDGIWLILVIIWRILEDILLAEVIAGELFV